MKYLFAILMLLLVNSAHAIDWQDSPEVLKIGVRGAFVLYDVAEDRLIGLSARSGIDF